MTAAPHSAVQIVRLAARSRPVRIHRHDGGYRATLSPPQGRQKNLSLSEADFVALVAVGKMVRLDLGHWSFALSPSVPHEGVDPQTLKPSGSVSRRLDVLGWLRSRLDQKARPMLENRAYLAGRQLQADWARAGGHDGLTTDVGRLLVDGGNGRSLWPVERALSARQKIRTAMMSIPQPARGLVELICLQEASMITAEKRLGLKPRSGRHHLHQGLTCLADHYGL